LADVVGHVRPDEKRVKDALVGDLSLGGPAVLLMTDQRVLWRLVQAGAPVLSLNFSDIWKVMVDEGTGVLLTYRPVDYPDELRSHNPNGELDAEFMFQPGDEDVRALVLGRAHGVVQLRAAGATLATGVGYLEGVLENEGYDVDVQAHESMLVLFMGGAPSETFSYSSVAWFRVGPLPEGLTASEHLGVGSLAIWLSLASLGVEDRWRLVVKPDDVERWRTILEYFSIRDAGRT
jgi:hypothetical protein